MNTQPRLTQYGIQNENSDIRAHVCPLAKRIYVYPTAEGLSSINTGLYRKVPAYQRGLKTAEGYLVPPRAINKIRRVPLTDAWIDYYGFSNQDDLGTKGQKASAIVCHLLRQGGFPLFSQPQVVEAQDMQMDGVDIIVRMNTRIQVKMDYLGGEGQPPITGNLFLQVSEANPFGIY